MAKLKEKIRTGLDEDRMLVLVVQVLIGFQFRAVLEPGFERLPDAAQYLKLAAFALLLLTLGLLLTAPSYHRIVFEGEDAAEFGLVLSILISCALLPFALALGIDFGVVTFNLFGVRGGIIGGCLATGTALFFWYGFEMLSEKRGKDGAMIDEEAEKTSLPDKIKQVLTEGRIVLPGAQALLGFQLSGFFTDAFEKLPRASQLLHLVALSFVALTAILLMTPPAYHRLVEKGEETERFHRVATRFVVSSMVPLALGISVDFYVVLKKVTESARLSALFAAIVLATFYGLWFVFSLLRARREPHRKIIAKPA